MTRGATVTLSIVGGLVVAAVVGFGVYFAASGFQLSSLLPSGTTKTPQFRASYIDGAKKSCTKSASQNNQSATAAQIETYCDCMANGSADLLTDDDVKYMLDHLGSIPPGFEQRMQPLLTQCLHTALGK